MERSRVHGKAKNAAEKDPAAKLANDVNGEERE
jgi:hypothetical protein